LIDDNAPETPEFSISFSTENLTDILAELDDGIVIIDANSTIVFYNKAMSRIDDMNPSDVIGKKISEVYASTQEQSATLLCMNQQKPVLKFNRFYLTQYGRAISAIQNAFPLFNGSEFTGVVNFTREYSSIEREMDTTSRAYIQKARQQTDKGIFQNIIGNTPELLQAIRTARMAATSPSPVMIHGESGTGKELFAQALHNSSPWSDCPFVAINCSAIPETLLEGILFGTAKGAFTDAKDKPGLFEDANGGTLFLDELNSMPIGLQAKLLRAIQENKIRRVGSSKEIDVNLKLLSSLNMDPEQAMVEKALRRDLYYRLAVVYIAIPPLRSRSSDIPALVEHFLQAGNTRLGRNVQAVSPKVLQIFMSYPWPGNVRELAHVIEGAMNMVDQKEFIDVADLPVNFLKTLKRNGPASPENTQIPPSGNLGLPLPPGPEVTGLTLFELQDQYEKSILCRLLEKYRGNANRAAQELGISRQLIYHKIKKHKLNRDDFKAAP